MCNQAAGTCLLSRCVAKALLSGASILACMGDTDTQTVRWTYKIILFLKKWGKCARNWELEFKLHSKILLKLLWVYLTAFATAHCGKKQWISWRLWMLSVMYAVWNRKPTEHQKDNFLNIIFLTSQRFTVFQTYMYSKVERTCRGTFEAGICSASSKMLHFSLQRPVSLHYDGIFLHLMLGSSNKIFYTFRILLHWTIETVTSDYMTAFMRLCSYFEPNSPSFYLEWNVFVQKFWRETEHIFYTQQRLLTHLPVFEVSKEWNCSYIS
jgi:hypothetical protein